MQFSNNIICFKCASQEVVGLGIFAVIVGNKQKG